MLKYHIETLEATSGTASSFNFDNIPQDYDDLMLVVSARSSRADTSDSVLLKFNETTLSSNMMLYYRGGENTYSFAVTTGFLINANADTSGTFGNLELLVSDYTNAGRAKPISFTGVTENNASRAYETIGAGLTPVTSAITSISIDPSNGDLMQYSSVSLYGIKRGSSGEVEVASGGTITTSGGYTYHTFTSSGTFVANRDLQVEALVIAGGGGSADNVGAGSGAGGVLASSMQVSPASYPVAIGAGGAGASVGAGNDGASSSALGFVAIGGGRGGTWTNGNGNPGGSGGGGAGYTGIGGAPTLGQGFAGGNGSGGPTYGGGGGGGGAGDVGGNAVSSSGGTGGPGTSAFSAWATATSTGVSGAYAGGGGGGAYNSSFSGTYPGGSGGGGTGTGNNGAAGGNGTANTGSGGGGGGPNGGNGGSGGSGIVIIRYLTPA